MNKEQRVVIICKTTNACNSNCFYCFDKPSHGKYPKIISKEIVLGAFNKLVQWFERIEWCWHGGEPLLAGPEFLDEMMFEMKQIAYRSNVELEFMIQTNGRLLTPEIVKLLDKYHVGMGVSYDGIVNNRSRGYEPNILSLDSSRSYLSVITKYNIDTLYESYIRANRENKSINFNMVYGPQMEFLLGDKTHAINRYYEYVMKYINDAGAHNTPGDRNIEDLICMAFGWETCCCESCDCFGSRIFCLNTNGDFYKCDETTVDKFNLGNYTQFNSLEDFISNTKYVDLYNQKEDIRKNYCSNCSLGEMCPGFCALRSYDFEEFQRPYQIECDIRRKIVPAIYNRLHDLTPYEFLNINPIVRKILIKNQYIPSYLKEQLLKEMEDHNANNSNIETDSSM